VVSHAVVCVVPSTESQLPKSWDPMSALESFKEVTLSPTCAEYRNVEQTMRSTAGNTVHQIISVNAYLLVSVAEISLYIRRNC